MTSEVKRVVQNRVDAMLKMVPPHDAISVCRWIERSITAWPKEEAEALAEIVAESMMAFFKEQAR